MAPPSVNDLQFRVIGQPPELLKRIQLMATDAQEHMHIDTDHSGGPNGTENDATTTYERSSAAEVPSLSSKGFQSSMQDGSALPSSSNGQQIHQNAQPATALNPADQLTRSNRVPSLLPNTDTLRTGGPATNIPEPHGAYPVTSACAYVEAARQALEDIHVTYKSSERAVASCNPALESYKKAELAMARARIAFDVAQEEFIRVQAAFGTAQAKFTAAQAELARSQEAWDAVESAISASRAQHPAVLLEFERATQALERLGHAKVELEMLEASRIAAEKQRQAKKEADIKRLEEELKMDRLRLHAGQEQHVLSSESELRRAAAVAEQQRATAPDPQGVSNPAQTPWQTNTLPAQEERPRSTVGHEQQPQKNHVEIQQKTQSGVNADANVGAPRQDGTRPSGSPPLRTLIDRAASLTRNQGSPIFATLQLSSQLPQSSSAQIGSDAIKLPDAWTGLNGAARPETRATNHLPAWPVTNQPAFVPAGTQEDSQMSTENPPHPAENAQPLFRPKTPVHAHTNAPESSSTTKSPSVRPIELMKTGFPGSPSSSARLAILSQSQQPDPSQADLPFAAMITPAQMLHNLRHIIKGDLASTAEAARALAGTQSPEKGRDNVVVKKESPVEQELNVTLSSVPSRNEHQNGNTDTKPAEYDPGAIPSAPTPSPTAPHPREALPAIPSAAHPQDRTFHSSDPANAMAIDDVVPSDRAERAEARNEGNRGRVTPPTGDDPGWVGPGGAPLDPIAPDLAQTPSRVRRTYDHWAPRAVPMTRHRGISPPPLDRTYRRQIDTQTYGDSYRPAPAQSTWTNPRKRTWDDELDPATPIRRPWREDDRRPRGYSGATMTVTRSPRRQSPETSPHPDDRAWSPPFSRDLPPRSWGDYDLRQPYRYREPGPPRDMNPSDWTRTDRPNDTVPADDYDFSRRPRTPPPDPVVDRAFNPPQPVRNAHVKKTNDPRLSRPVQHSPALRARSPPLQVPRRPENTDAVPSTVITLPIILPPAPTLTATPAPTWTSIQDQSASLTASSNLVSRIAPAPNPPTESVSLLERLGDETPSIHRNPLKRSAERGNSRGGRGGGRGRPSLQDRIAQPKQGQQLLQDRID